jgi:hypothetical protein
VSAFGNHEWGVFDEAGLLVHIAPLGDTRPHTLDDVAECDCCPVYHEEGLVIHYSFDGRERYGAVH